MKSKLIKGYNGEYNGLILNMNLPSSMKSQTNDKEKNTDL